MQKLLCKSKNYDWGSFDQESITAKFAKAHSEEIENNEEEVENNEFKGPFAEFWMGNHPNGQSYFVDLDKPFDKNLSFLFKYLSVKSPLSIQLHPDKKTAEILHKTNPDIYKDDNHKPEMAIALTKTTLLYGFKENWREILASYPELEQKETLEELITYLLNFDKIILIKDNQLFLDLYRYYPDDNGILIALFMNYITLEPDEAIVIKPNIPHAYLSGELVECMACSDNVIRLGLTSKYKDVESALKCISYDTNIPKLVTPKDGYYSSGFKEFDVIKIQVDPEQTDIFYCKSPSILSVYSGKGVIEIEENTYIIDPYTVHYVYGRSIISVFNSNPEPLIIWVACSPNL
jgi:mannose-6-phosphate isomerase